MLACNSFKIFSGIFFFLVKHISVLLKYYKQVIKWKLRVWEGTVHWSTACVDGTCERTKITLGQQGDLDRGHQLVKTHRDSHSFLELHSLTVWLLLSNNPCAHRESEPSCDRKCKSTPQSDPEECIGVKLWVWVWWVLSTRAYGHWWSSPVGFPSTKHAWAAFS